MECNRKPNIPIDMTLSKEHPEANGKDGYVFPLVLNEMKINVLNFLNCCEYFKLIEHIYEIFKFKTILFFLK